MTFRVYYIDGNQKLFESPDMNTLMEYLLHTNAQINKIEEAQ